MNARSKGGADTDVRRNAQNHCRACSDRYRPNAFPYLWVALALAVLPMLCSGAVGPRLSVRPQTVDLGDLRTESGQTLFPARFALTNSGDQVLTLGKVRAACGCTKVQLSASELEPGQSTELTATLDITGRYGQQRFSILVPSNAPGPPRRLLIEASIPDTRTGWELMPAMLHVRDEAPVSVHVRHFDTDAELRILALDLPDGCAAVTALPLSVPAGGTGRIDIRCSAAFVAAGGRHAFAVRSDHADKPRAKGWLNVRTPRAAGLSSKRTTGPALAQASGNVSEGAAAAPIVPIEADILQQLLESIQAINDLHVLDVRSPQDYARGHIPRSISYPPTKWQTANPPWANTAMLVIVAGDDEAARRAAEILATAACRHVLTLRGGIEVWTAVAGRKSLVTGGLTQER